MGEHTNTLSRRNFILGTTALGASLAAAGLAVPETAHAVTSAQKRAEAAAVLESLNAMQLELDKASDDYFTALAEQEAAQAKMDEAQAAIDEANAQIAELQDHLGTRARSMYRSGSLSFIDILLGATDFKSFASNWDLLNDMNEDDADAVQQTKDLKAEVEAQKAVYEEQERIAAEKAAEAEKVKAEAEAMVAEMQATYDQLSAEAAELLAQEEAARAEAERQAALAAQQQSSGSSSAGDNKAQTVTGNVVVDRAYAQLGKPYVWGACGPNSFDCSGLVGYCLTGNFRRYWTTYEIDDWPRVSNPVPGDICIRNGHTGVYIGGGQMIHAPRTGDVVKVAPVQRSMWYVRY
ncbi:MAG: C40 family peptidase [Eggerthellaceae bacterium]|nr:C40 family peptidase [Eggerthellaceae bacterium]